MPKTKKSTPCEYDAVLGGITVPPGTAVLGGFEGAKRLFTSHPTAGIAKLLKYPEGREIAFKYLRQPDNAHLMLEHYHYLLNDLFPTPQDTLNYVDGFARNTGKLRMLTGLLTQFCAHPLITIALGDLARHAETNGVVMDSTPSYIKTKTWEVPICDREVLGWQRRTLRIRITGAFCNPHQIDLKGGYVGHLVMQEGNGAHWTTATHYLERDILNAGIQVIKYALYLNHPRLPLSPTRKLE